MPVILLALLAAFASLSSVDTSSTSNHPSRLLLSARRLKRLQRDRERQTVRWVNFENRVKSVPDSPERGFELALYFAVTNDKPRGLEAVQWASQHPCEKRQVGLILDWVEDLIPEDRQKALSSQSCTPAGGTFTKLRNDVLFGSSKSVDFFSFTPELESKLTDPKQLYALVEYLDMVRSTKRIDLRESDRQFFGDLPIRFLLSMRPEELEHPSWQAHVAALALVGLDPNLSSSQFLQGWAMEDRYTLQDGPGVAYEFLWADPYLPGVSYQNMDPWLYDANGHLIARTDWTAQACWISIGSGIQDQKCPADWQAKRMTFGRLTLVPMLNQCVDLPNSPNNQTFMLWKMAPGKALSYEQSDQKESATADKSGLWRVTPNAHGKVCLGTK